VYLDRGSRTVMFTTAKVVKAKSCFGLSLFLYWYI